jgi:DNA repair protein RadD
MAADTINLRDYQQDAIDSVYEYWAVGGGNPLVVMPTGSGKSLTMAGLMQRLLTEHEGTRILLMTHVQELVEQDAEAVQKIWPEAPVGIYSAGLNRRDGAAPLVFASVQSVSRSPDVIGERHVVIIDEAHLLSRKESGQYQTVLKHLKKINPSMRLAGFTATDYRTDSGLLTEGWRGGDPLFDEVVYRVEILKLMERGLLSRLVPYAPRTRLDVTGVKKNAGDYIQKDLQAAVDTNDLNERAVDEIIAAGHDREGWIVFAAGVEHAEHLRDVIRSRGVECEMILGDTPKAERKEIIARFKAKKLRCVVGNNVLTTGFDAPHIDLVAMLRPTKSRGLHVQMIGRGLRIAPGKSECIVLDFAGNTLEHGPIDTIDGSKTPGGAGSMPAKECESCGAICHISATVCPNGHEFPIIEKPKFSATPNGAPILSNQQEPVWFDVTGVIVRRHKKEGSPDSLRIDYTTGLATVSNWLSLDHPTASAMARRWWENNSHSGEAPRASEDGSLSAVDKALANYEDIRIPGRVMTMKEGKYQRIVKFDYSIPPNTIIPVKRQLVGTAPVRNFGNWSNY